jgi:hypothetical protein
VDLSVEILHSTTDNKMAITRRSNPNLHHTKTTPIGRYDENSLAADCKFQLKVTQLQILEKYIQVMVIMTPILKLIPMRFFVRVWSEPRRPKCSSVKLSSPDKCKTN